jgi:hypothetical protein
VKGAKDDHAEQKLREYLILANRANERPKSANDAIAKAKINRNNGLRVWAWFVESGELVKHSKGGYYLADREGEM